jgi:hypothetical protein
VLPIGHRSKQWVRIRWARLGTAHCSLLREQQQLNRVKLPEEATARRAIGFWKGETGSDGARPNAAQIARHVKGGSSIDPRIIATYVCTRSMSQAFHHVHVTCVVITFIFFKRIVFVSIGRGRSKTDVSFLAKSCGIMAIDDGWRYILLYQ